MKVEADIFPLFIQDTGDEFNFQIMKFLLSDSEYMMK